VSTLLLRLAGPMQSWGTQSRFTERDTGRDPSKSGVIGLLCAALGWSRDVELEKLARLARLHMGVRIDRQGVMRMEYQTAGGSHRRDEHYGVAIVEGGMRTVVSRRYYLADADFLVGLAGGEGHEEDEATLRMVDDALKNPRWPLFLGRRSFVPGEPVRLPDDPPARASWRSEPLRDALINYPWPQPRHRRETFDQLQFVFETEAGADAGAEARRDVPISFQSDNRVFAVRYVTTESIRRPEGKP